MTKHCTSLLFALTLGATSVWACSYDPYPTPACQLIRITNPNMGNVEEELNCQQWQSETSTACSINYIHTLVYDMSQWTLQAMKNGQYTGNNSFARWIIANKRVDIIDYLLLAKEYSRLSRLARDEWYFPPSKTHTTPERLYKKLNSYRGPLQARYDLQKIRLLRLMNKELECVQLWDSIASSTSASTTREMMKNYVVGARHLLGMNCENKDISQLESIHIWIYRHKGMGYLQAINDVYKSCPRNKYLLEFTTDRVYPYQFYENEEELKTICCQWQSDHFNTSQIDGEYGKAQIDSLYNFIKRVATERRTSEQAEWFYLASWFADWRNRPLEAKQMLRCAEVAQHNEYLAESIRVMRTHLDAKYRNLDANYTRQLLNDIKWLNDKSISELNNRPTSIYNFYTSQWQDFQFPDVWEYRDNHYFNRAMKRIVNDELCPRLVRAHRFVEALHLLNVAQHSLVMHCVEQVQSHINLYRAINDSINNDCSPEYQRKLEYYTNKRYDCHSSHLFKLLDTIPTSEIEAYLHTLSNPHTPFERFCADNSMKDLDFFYDVLGTRYIRAQRYDKAVKWLVKMSPSYPMETAVSAYFNRLPFDVDSTATRPLHDYKLSFAREMCHLEQDMRIITDPSRKGLLMLRYALGLRNSVGYCWTLTSFRRYSSDHSNHDYETGTITLRLPNAEKNVYIKTATLISQAMAMITDKECRAEAHLMLRNYAKAVGESPHSRVAEYIKTHCDKLIDYHDEHKVYYWDMFCNTGKPMCFEYQYKMVIEVVL